MATKDELNNDKESLRIFDEKVRKKKEAFELDKQNLELSKGDLDISYSSLANLREIYGIKSNSRDIDRDIFKNAKAINRQLLGQESSLANIREYNRENLKNERLLLESITLEKAALREVEGIRKGGSESVDKALEIAQQRDEIIRREKNSLQDQLDIQQELNQLSKEGKEDTQEFEDKIFELNQIGDGIILTQEAVRKLDKEFENFLDGKDKEGNLSKIALQNDTERAAFNAKYNRKQLEETNNLRKAAVKALEPTSNFLDLLGNIPGLGKITSSILDEVVSELDKTLTQKGKAVDFDKESADAQSKALTKLKAQVLNMKNFAGVISGFVLKGLFEVNSAQTELTREIGRGVDAADLLGGSIVLISDQVRIATALTQQFGFAATSAFDSVNLLAATELEQLTGLTADQAGRFALFSQTTGTSLDDNLDTIISQVGEINIANKSAVTQRQIFRDIGDTSSAIALTFQGNTVELARSAQQARILGLTLSQIDNIAAGLLDIESSIRSEFEAEVITGKQLNLERARFFALTNDLTGLTEELAANQEIINKFATGNRIEQEAIAGALNMSRDEMADMIFQQRLQLGITDEQARLTAGLTQADFERLTINESIATSLAKIGETLSVVVEPILRGAAKYSFLIYTALASLATVSLVKTAISLAQMAVSAGAIGAALSPIGIAALAVGVISIIGTITAGLLTAKKQVGDAIIPAGKGPIISTQEGGLIQGTENDDIVMAPGVAKTLSTPSISTIPIRTITNNTVIERERNTGTGTVTISDEQLQRITSAVSRAQLNINGKRASSLLQPDFAVTTYSYSV
jgi:hypothetical protein